LPVDIRYMDIGENDDEQNEHKHHQEENDMGAVLL